MDFAYPPSLNDALNDDQELNRLLPFLALPDGAHLVSIFHGTSKIVLICRAKKTILIS